MPPVLLINAVGLSPSVLAHAPRLRALAAAAGQRALRPVFPAVTCSVQASMLTGLPASGHGIVANGWFHEETQEVRFWLQSNKLVAGDKVWETLKKSDPTATCLNSFWWFNMYSSTDYAITPRPQYRADGRKVPDCYSQPPELRDELQAKLGTFPLFRFWGPLADITSTRWIADATLIAWRKFRPTLTLCYLPHLDYPLQKYGPNHPRIPAEVAALDAVVGDLLDFCAAEGIRPLVVSEYGIEPATRVIMPNRLLRQAGLLAVREENGREYLDAGASRAFAIADHQAAFIHAKTPADADAAQAALAGQGALHAAEHPRGGAFALEAPSGAWYAHDWWLDEAKAPDYQKTVDIHKKPGYDPRELFCAASKAGIAWRLFQRKLGFRTLLDVLPMDPNVVQGTHGRMDSAPEYQPLLLGAGNGPALGCTAVKDVVLAALGKA